MATKSPTLESRKYFTPIRDAMDLPDLVTIQKDSYEWFLKEGIGELLHEISGPGTLTIRSIKLELDGIPHELTGEYECHPGQRVLIEVTADGMATVGPWLDAEPDGETDSRLTGKD